MLRRLGVLATCLLGLVGWSGCCLFCPHHYCHSGRAPGYGACVSPDGCPDCGSGIYGVSADPVVRARQMRMARLRGGQCGPACRRRHADALYGYEDPYGIDLCGCSDCCGADMLGGGWTVSDGCGCGNAMSTMSTMPTAAGGWTEGAWVEQQPTPQPAPQTLPPVPQPAPQPMSSTMLMPKPMPAADEQYYMPRVMPAANTVGPTTSTAPASMPGSPVQPVLWVPGGL